MADEAKVENWVDRTAFAIHGASIDVVGAEAKVREFQKHLSRSGKGLKGRVVPWMLAVLHTPANLMRIHAQAIAETLRTREYVLLQPRQKLTIMRALIHMALASEVLREHINARVEMFAVKNQLLAGKLAVQCTTGHTCSILFFLARMRITSSSP